MKVCVTGGAGFIGSHVAEYYAKKEDEVVVLDNLSREELLKVDDTNALFNWKYLNKNYPEIEFIRGDIRSSEDVNKAAEGADAIIHTAAQTAVTASVNNPRTDFEVNLQGTFNILEAARKSKENPAIVYCSTNKVYGENVNKIPIQEKEKHYEFDDPDFEAGIPEDFPIDLCEHTPYGCSKLGSDIYVQDVSACGSGISFWLGRR